MENLEEINMENNVNKIKFELDLELTDDDIDGFVCSAIERGISHWCDNVSVVGCLLGEYEDEQISKGGKLNIHNREDDITYELTKEKFLIGLKLCLENKEMFIECVYSYSSRMWNFELAPECINDIEADKIIQYALFGEIRYRK